MNDAGASTVQISPEDRDFAIRTMIGEEGAPDGMAGVASTILNRAQSGKFGGSSLKSVVLAPSQFEPWSARPADLLSVPTDDPRYKQAAQIFDGVASGNIPDLTNGATHFYAPVAQAKLNRPTPNWSAGQQGVPLGQTLFFAPNGPVNYKPPPAVGAINAATSTAGAALKVDPKTGLDNYGGMNGTKVVNGTAVHSDTGQPYTPAEVQSSLSTPAQLAKTAPTSPSDPSIAKPAGGSFLKDFPATSTAAQSSAGPAFLKDFPADTDAPAVASSSSSGQPPAFLKDFPAEEVAQPSTTPPIASSGINNLVRATSEGVPIIGGLLNKLDAGTNATIAPIFNRFFSPSDQLQGDTWSDRYNNSLAAQNSSDAQFAQQHPVANTAANVAGAVAGTIPAMLAAPGAFGLGGGSLLANSLAGGASGAAINAADSGIRNGFTLPNVASGALTGAAAGSAGPVIGKALGAGVNAVSNAFTGAGPAASKVASYLTDLGLSPQDVQAELTRLGPSATIADVDPALTTKAAALAAKGGAPTSILKNAFATRAADADNRVGQVIDTALGPKPDLTATEEGIYAKAQAAASPHYDAARANPTPMDVTPILDDIGSRLDAGAVGGTKANLTKTRDLLTAGKVDVPGPDGQPLSMTVPKDDPQSLLAVRQELDDMIQKAPQSPETTGAKNAVGALKDMRASIDSVLKTDPNIAAGDAAFSQQMRIKEALQQGTELFTKGTRLEDFNRALTTATPDEADAMRQGARVAIGDAFENARQGTLSAANSMFGKATANRAKLDALFPNAGDVFDKIAAEQTLRGNEQWIGRNSKTAQTTEAMKEFDLHPPQGSPSILPAIAGYAMGGDVGAAAAVGAKNGFGAIKNALTEASRGRLMKGLATGLSATGPEQNLFMGRVGMAYNAAPATAAVTSAGNVGSNLLARTGAQRAQRIPANLLVGAGAP